MARSELLGFGLFRNDLGLTRPGDRLRLRKRFGISSRIGLDEEIVGYLFSIGDASQDVHLRSPLSRLVQCHKKG